ncbi:MAG: DNA repair protein RadC [Bacillota bacterium]|nr:DNA repair protein RadC [Bacillota bacterium]
MNKSGKIEGYLTEEMPIERLVTNGPQSLSTTELLSIVLGIGTKGINVVELSREILSASGGLKELSKQKFEQLMQVKGVGRSKAAKLLATFELARRLDEITLKDRPMGNSPDAIYEYAKYKLRFKDREHFLVLLLNTKHEIISHDLVSIGTGDRTFAEPKEVFKLALQVGAYAICVCHNHPSGHVNPSKADLHLTARLVESGNLLGIPVLDHLIIGENDYYSLKANGDM